jgi:hypothetical protein
MSEALLTQHIVAQVLGASRLQRLLRAGWLAPRERTPSRVLFSQRDLHAALQRLERGEALPPDRTEVARVRASEERNGHPRVRKEKVRPVLDLSAIKLDFSSIPEGPEVYD